MQPAPLTGTATDDRSPPKTSSSMQPAPLTGTATVGAYAQIAVHVDAARAPHGDSNICGRIAFSAVLEMQPAPLTGTATSPESGLPSSGSFRCSPHPSRGQQLFTSCSYAPWVLCSPHPSRGQQLYVKFIILMALYSDAARTPHGDSNITETRSILHFVDAARSPHGDSNRFAIRSAQIRCMMQPAPLTGTATSYHRSH